MMIALALFAALSVQALSSPLAITWLPLTVAGCFTALRKGYPERSAVWYAALAWLVTILLCGFVLMPVANGSTMMFTVAVAPLIAVTVKEYDLRWVFGVIALFAFGCILQQVLHVSYTQFREGEMGGRAWPCLDPNNGALIINCALIPCFYRAFKNPKWLLAVLFFAVALAITHSRMGGVAALAGCTLILMTRYGVKALLAEILIVWFALLNIFTFWPTRLVDAYEAVQSRLPIWTASLKLLFIHPYTGLGWGQFPRWYEMVKTEPYPRWYAHNDILQIIIEAGFPAVLVFIGLLVTVCLTTRKTNIVSAAIILAIFLQAMMEFQFYVPAVSILFGLALAYHMRK